MSGTSHYSDIVPFIVHCFWECDTNDLHSDASALLYGGMDNDDEAEVGRSARGWTVLNNEQDVGKRNNVFGVLVRKGDHEVCLINESPYAAVCCEATAVVGNTREAVQAFIDDWEDTRTSQLAIEDIDTVEQHL